MYMEKKEGVSHLKVHTVFGYGESITTPKIQIQFIRIGYLSMSQTIEMRLAAASQDQGQKPRFQQINLIRWQNRIEAIGT